MVDGSHEIGTVLGCVHVEVPIPLQQFGLAVGQVGAQHSGEDAVFHGLVELVQAAGEQGEGGVGDDVLGAPLFQLTGHFQHALAGGNDVVGDEHGLALHALAQILMGDDGIPAIDHPGIVSALVEHTQVAAQNAGEIHIPVNGAFIGGDDNEIILVKTQVGHMVQQGFQHLIGGHHVVEAHQGHGVHQPGVMGIEGDNIGNAHALQLLEGNGAVQTLPSHPAVLPSAVEGGHDDGHPVGTARHRLNQTLQVGKMIVRGHMVFVTEQIIGQGVVAGVNHEEHVVAANGIPHQALGVAALEPGAITGDDKGFLRNANFLRPVNQVAVDELGQFFGAGTGDQAQVGDLGVRGEKAGGLDTVFRHFR